MSTQFWTALIALGGPLVALTTILVGRKSRVRNDRHQVDAQAADLITQATERLISMMAVQVEQAHNESKELRLRISELEEFIRVSAAESKNEITKLRLQVQQLQRRLG